MLRKLAKPDEAGLPCQDGFTGRLPLAEFVDWCEKYRLFIEQGRTYGFRLAAGVKDAIALQLPKDVADRINASLLDVQ